MERDVLSSAVGLASRTLNTPAIVRIANVLHTSFQSPAANDTFEIGKGNTKIFDDVDVSLNNSKYTFEELWSKIKLNEIKIQFLQIASDVADDKTLFQNKLNNTLTQNSINYYKRQNKFILTFKKFIPINKRERIKSFLKFLLFGRSTNNFIYNLNKSDINYCDADLKNIEKIILNFY